MKVRDYGYLDADNRIVYADDYAEIDGANDTSPTPPFFRQASCDHLLVNGRGENRVYLL